MPRLSRIIERVGASELVAGVSERVRLWSVADVVSAISNHAPEPPPGAEVLWTSLSATASSSDSYLQLANGYVSADTTGPGSSLSLRAWGDIEIDAGSGTPSLSVRMGDEYLQVDLGVQTATGIWSVDVHASRSTSTSDLRCRLMAAVSSSAGNRVVHALATDSWVDSHTYNFFNVAAKWDTASADRRVRIRGAELIHVPKP